MSENRQLCIIESPFQLIQLYEYLKYKKLTQVFVCIRLNKEVRNNSQLYALVKLFSPEDWKIIYLKNPYTALVVAFFYRCFCDYFVLGDENSKVVKLFLPFLHKERITFLDDGVATLDSTSKYNRFTIFSQIAGERNHMLELRKMVESVKKTQRVVLLLGSKLTETGILDFKAYEELVKKVIISNRKEMRSDLKLVYVPHRGETAHKNILNDKFCQRYGVLIVENHLPVELISVEKGYDIKGVIGFFSTALFTLRQIYPSATVKVYLIPHELLMKRKQKIKRLYQQLIEQGYKVCYLEH